MFGFCPIHKFFIFQNEHIVRMIDSRILGEGPPRGRVACILMELGEMDFEKYLHSSAPAPEGTMPHCHGRKRSR